MNKINEEKAHVLFLDECVFKARDFNRSAWSAPKQKITVFDRTSY